VDRGVLTNNHRVAKVTADRNVLADRQTELGVLATGQGKLIESRVWGELFAVLELDGRPTVLLDRKVLALLGLAREIGFCSLGVLLRDTVCSPLSRDELTRTFIAASPFCVSLPIKHSSRFL
jgi:hypothetical protein